MRAVRHADHPAAYSGQSLVAQARAPQQPRRRRRNAAPRMHCTATPACRMSPRPTPLALATGAGGQYHAGKYALAAQISQAPSCLS